MDKMSRLSVDVGILFRGADFTTWVECSLLQFCLTRMMGAVMASLGVLIV